MSFQNSTFIEHLFSGENFNFEKKAIELFQFQYQNNATYSEYCKLINCNPKEVISIETIPFLPISAFKSHDVKTEKFEAQEVFTSSGTTGTATSKHYVKDLEIYCRSFTKGFELFYGKVEEYTVLGLLPAYLERKGSSLIYMVNNFIEKSKDARSGFFLENRTELAKILTQLAAQKKKTLLIGVSFGLLDFAEEYKVPYNDNLIIMETGGMKGRRKEMIREELHEQIKPAFNARQIHSEYGMTELLSQAYSLKDGLFSTPPWMKILLRLQDDPFNYSETINSGAINIIDLANIYSCAFIATDDLGKRQSNQKFEILGRFDAAEVRGCNLMIT